MNLSQDRRQTNSTVIATALFESLFDRGERVPDWPEDERDLHRNGDWGSFEERHQAVRELRFKKATTDVLTALDETGVVLVDGSAPLDLVEGAAIALYGERRPYKEWDAAPEHTQVLVRREAIAVLRSLGLIERQAVAE